MMMSNQHGYSVYGGSARPAAQVEMAAAMKRSAGDGGQQEKKKKHVSLSIKQKVELLQKLECGVSVRSLTEEYGVGATTIYDLKKQKEELMTVCKNADDPELMQNRKTLRSGKNKDMDRLLIEWVRQRRREGVPLTSATVKQQARIFHEQLNLEGQCQYSDGWLRQFKKRHGLKDLKFCGERDSSAEAAENYSRMEEFAKIIAGEKLTPEQIYNADETALFWHYVPRKALIMSNEERTSVFRDCRDRLTVLGCANAAGTHKVKLAVIGKSQRPKSLKGVLNLPVHYYAHKKAWITAEIFYDWFNNHFVPEARAHCKQSGLDENCKIVLLLDNSSAHPPAELLVNSNVFGIYLSPDVTSVLQPCDQGILHSMKVKYKEKFLTCMLASVGRGATIQDFLKEFNVKDAIYTLSKAWDDVPKSTLTNAWHGLFPTTVFDENDPSDNFEGFRITNEEVILNLVTYAKRLSYISVNKLDEADIEEVLNADNDVPVANSSSDGDEMVLSTVNSEDSCSDDDDDDDDEDTVNSSETIPIGSLVEMCDRLITGLEQRAIISEQHIMAVYSIKESLLAHQLMLMRQTKLEEAFKRNFSQ